MLDDANFLLLSPARFTTGRRFRAWHGATRARHDDEVATYTARGFRIISLSLHGTGSAHRYSGVMVDPALFIEAEIPVPQRHFSSLTAAQFQQTFDAQAAEGYGPSLLSATGPSHDPRFAVVFEPAQPIPRTRFGLRSGPADDPTTYEGLNARAGEEGLVLRWAASYGGPGDERFAAIWSPNTRRTVWNADGVLESASEHETRSAAQLSGWARPAFVTHNGARYLSLFVHDDIGPWVARHDLTSSAYQSEVDSWVSKGYVPTCVQGSGSGVQTRYSAIFVKRMEPVPDRFTATGPVAHADIDDLVYQAMRDSPVWNASLAIVHRDRLVYTRGYSWGEPDWPVVQPTTRFRIASVSKTIGALGIYQLLESGALTLDTRVQDVLGLTTPSGAPPTDPRFASITVRHLLEHTSGITPQAMWRDLDAQAAFEQAYPHQAWPLPITPSMTDAFIASRVLVSDPGATQLYNNTGYYLLGRVLAKIAGRDTAFEALRERLFDLLDMARSRPSPTDLATMPADEARYRAQDLRLVRSSIHADRRLVPVEYGNNNLAKTGTAGGLSMAAVDLGRIAAVLMAGRDVPGIQRATIDQMMSAGIATQAAFGGRAGHGWDGTAVRSGGRYYAQKGGSLSTSGNVLQIDGDWGYALCWAGKATAANALLGGYPNNAIMMNVAKSVSWTRDLFPDFGMAPLP
jgi:CubicO group peptidase (beta-lactamase class C family)